MKKRILAAAMALCLSFTLFSPAVFAAEKSRNTGVMLYSDVTDIIGPRPPKPDETEKPNANVVLPNMDELNTNQDFLKYDPGYPKREQYGDYTFHVPKLKGRLTFSAGSKGMVGTLFAPGITGQAGWKDANKVWLGKDSGLCFAAASSNLISWYLDQYKKSHPDDPTQYLTDVERVFDKFRNGWDPAKGGDPKEALSWYFTGGFPSNSPQANDNQLNYNERGGYLQGSIPHNNSKKWTMVSLNWNPQEAYDAFGSQEDGMFPFMEELNGNYDYPNKKAPLSSHKGFSDHILRQLHYGACTISIMQEGNSNTGHAITLWGADYDVNTGLISAIYVTDSDDSKVNLIKVPIEMGPGEKKGGRCDGIRMVRYPYQGPGATAAYTKIRDSIVLYAPDVVQKTGSGGQNYYDGPAPEISSVTTGSDGQGVTIQVSNIPNHTVEYGYSYDQDVNNVVSWQTSSHFSSLKPDQYYFFARIKEEPNLIIQNGVSSPYAYRIAVPSPVSGESVPSLSLGTDGFHAPNGKEQYIWYGTENGADGAGSEQPILWKVLNTKTNHGQTGLFLLSDSLFGTGKDGGLNFSSQNSSSYQGSSAQNWCQNFADRYFHTQERNAILSTTKSDNSYSVVSNGVKFSAQENILNNDKVFLPSAEEMMTSSYGFHSESSRQSIYRGNNFAYWLRSPAEQNSGFAGHVSGDGSVFSNDVQHEAAARPAFNLDSSRVLYAAAVGDGQFTDETGLKQIKSVPSCDFRLVLKDDSRAFQVNTSELTIQPGEAVKLSYKGAVADQTGNEFISVILTDSKGKPIYYGKITPAESSDGTLSLDLPDELGEGSYTLKVFNEQYNGQMRSGIASAFSDVTLTIKEEPAVEPLAQVDLTVTAPVKGQTPKNATANNRGYTVVKTTWAPDHDVFKANTHYDVTITVKADSGYELTADTAFRVNGHSVTAKAQGDTYIMTYTGFKKTEADSSGSGTAPANPTKPTNPTKPAAPAKPTPPAKPTTPTKPSTPTKPTIPPTESNVTFGPDGSKIETITNPDGTKIETITSQNGDQSVTQTKKDGSVTTSIKKVDGTVANISKDKNAHTKAEVVLSKKAVSEAKKSGKSLLLPISSVESGTSSKNAPVIEVENEGKETVKVTIPVSSLNYNSVAVIVNKDGSEKVIRKSANTKDGLSLSLESGTVIKIFDNTKTFSDTSGHWAKDFIDFVASHELYAGTSTTTFGPNVGMTRGMLAVVLHSLENNPNSNADMNFGDVMDGDWYDDAIRWANEKGMVAGYGNGKFGPNDQIKREQLALMLYRYAGSPAHSSTALNFQDADEVSSYAVKAMQWAVDNGIISGTGNNTLNPKGTATRAQVATMLMRYIENVN